jgi:hypothetical protein
VHHNVGVPLTPSGRAWIPTLVALAILGGLAGCGDDSGGGLPPTPSRAPSGGLIADSAPPSAVGGVRVLYDDAWTVEEGQWWLGSARAYFDQGDLPTFHRILESVNRGSVSITVPAADGNYLTRVELHQSAPAIPEWCEDVAEASLEVPPAARAITMGSLEALRDLWVPGPGWYRVRYCTEEQDRAASEDAFVGEEQVTYTGRHLVQVWPAPRSPDQLLREGSAWARATRTQG